MARTKRSAASVAGPDENSLATPPQPTTKRTRSSQPASSKKTRAPPQTFEHHSIDDPIRAPCAETVPIDPIRDVVNLAQPCFPDIFQGVQYEKLSPSTDRVLLRLAFDLQQSPVSGDWCEYPERAAEGEQMVQKESYDLAVESGAIPPPTDDILVFEQVLRSPEYVPAPPSFSPFTKKGSGDYVGFRRAVLAELTQVLIQPVMTAGRAVISSESDGSPQYEYEDRNSSKPRYESVTYSRDHVATTAEFNAISEKSFKSQEDNDPYHQLSKGTKPRGRYTRADHAYPLPLIDRKLEGLTVWVVPPSVRQSKDGEPDEYLILTDESAPRLLRSGIRPEMMPYVRVALRPLRGCPYDGWSAERAYRWSVYLRVDKINAVLRSGDFGARTAIRDLLVAVGRQVGWVADGECDKQLAGVGFMTTWDVSRLSLTRSTPEALAKHFDFDDHWMLAWLRHRELPAQQTLSIDPSPVRLYKKLIQLGPNGMFFEPFTGLFFDALPDRVLSPRPPIAISCTDSLVRSASEEQRRRVILGLLAVDLDQPLGDSRPHLPVSLGQELLPSPATLILCRANQVDAWAKDFTARILPLHPARPIVTIRNITDFAAISLEQVQKATLVIVAAEFLLHDYISVLTAATNCTHSRHCWLWSQAFNRTYCADAKLRAALDPDTDHTCRHRIMAPTAARDFHSTLAECTATTFEKRTDVFSSHNFKPLKVHLPRPPVFLHMLRWHRLVFDRGVSRDSRCSDYVFELELGGRRAAAGAGLEPLREFIADSTVTFLGGPNECRRKCGACSDQTTKVYRLLGLTPGDVPPEDKLSMRAKWELLNAVSFSCRADDEWARWGDSCLGD